jgi:hypothetical protein
MLLLWYNFMRRNKIVLQRIHLETVHEEEGQPEIPLNPCVYRSLVEDRYYRLID